MAIQFTIKHHTCYQYMENVFLEPHVIRFSPRRDKHVRILSMKTIVSPQPLGMNSILELDGTAATTMWFKGMTKSFEIKSEMLVEVEPFNPFEFIIYPSSCLRLPLVYPIEWAPLLSPYIEHGSDIPEIKMFAVQLAESCGYETVTFLTTICKVIYEEFSYEKRPHGNPYRPEDTLKHKKGSCRDFTVLVMAICRHLGLACRYISGYYLSEDEDEPGDLHAWLEIFLPGAGWKGFDPSHGIICGHHHIALSASADPALTLPVTGAFRGFSSSRMKVELAINKVPNVSLNSNKI